MLAGDCLQNLRVALDHLAWSLALRNRPNPDRRTAFPICGTEDQWLGRKDRDGKRMSEGGERNAKHCGRDAQDIMCDLQPYRLVQRIPLHQQALWVFNELARVDRHQTLTTTIPQNQAMKIMPYVPPQLGNVIIDGPSKGQLVTRSVQVPDDQRSMEFSGAWSGGDGHEHKQVAFFVAIDPNWPVASGTDLVATLRTCETDTWGVVERFDGCFSNGKTTQEVMGSRQN